MIVNDVVRKDINMLEDLVFKQKEALHIIFDYLKENGHEGKSIVVHPDTFRKWVRCRTRSPHSPQNEDDIRFTETKNIEDIVNKRIYGWLDWNDLWQIPIKISTQMSKDEFYLIKD